MHAPPPRFNPTLAPRLGVILRQLAALIAQRFLRDPLKVALIIPLWRLFTRAADRLARLAAGPRRPPRLRARNHSGPHRKPVFPTGRAWLLRALGAEAAACAGQLEAVLAEPAAADLLASTAARRVLAPIRRMLGLTPPVPRPRRARPAPHPPAPPPIAPYRTLDPPPTRPRRPWWLPPPHLRPG